MNENKSKRIMKLNDSVPPTVVTVSLKLQELSLYDEDDAVSL